MALGGGLGSGPSCCSRILVFSVRQTSQIGMPALSLWQLCITFHLRVGSSVLVVFKSQYLFDRVVPALFGFFRSIHRVHLADFEIGHQGAKFI